MSTSKKDWESIKKQIKKTIEKTPSKETQRSHHANWEEIEQQLRNKHKKHDTKQKQTPQELPLPPKPTPPPPKKEEESTEDWTNIQKEIDSVFQKYPARYIHPRSRRHQKKTIESIDTFIKSPSTPKPEPPSEPPSPTQKKSTETKKRPSLPAPPVATKQYKQKKKKTRAAKYHPKLRFKPLTKQKKKSSIPPPRISKEKKRKTPATTRTQRRKQLKQKRKEHYRLKTQKKHPRTKTETTALTQSKGKTKPTPSKKQKKTQETPSFFQLLKAKIPFTIIRPTFTTIHPKTFFVENIVEIILFVLGLVFLLPLAPSNMKIGLTLMLIASYLFFLMIDDKSKTTASTVPLSYLPQKTTDAQPSAYYLSKTQTPKPPRRFLILLKRIFRLPRLPRIHLKTMTLTLTDRITIILISWTLLLFIITADIEIFFILIFIGILITKEMTDIYTSKGFKLRLNAYIILFLLVYVILISQKIITILQT